MSRSVPVLSFSPEHRPADRGQQQAEPVFSFPVLSEDGGGASSAALTQGRINDMGDWAQGDPPKEFFKNSVHF